MHCRCPVVISSIRGVIHHAVSRRIQPYVPRALSFKQCDRWAQAKCLCCCLHCAFRYEPSLPLLPEEPQQNKILKLWKHKNWGLQDSFIPITLPHFFLQFFVPLEQGSHDKFASCQGEVKIHRPEFTTAMQQLPSPQAHTATTIAIARASIFSIITLIIQ